MKLTAEDSERIADLTRRGWTARAIAEELGVTARTVSRHRQAQGVAQPPAPRYSPDVRAKAEQLLDDGASYREVARTLGLSQDRAPRWFPGRGWTSSQANELRALYRTLNRI